MVMISYCYNHTYHVILYSMPFGIYLQNIHIISTSQIFHGKCNISGVTSRDLQLSSFTHNIATHVGQDVVKTWNWQITLNEYIGDTFKDGFLLITD